MFSKFVKSVSQCRPLLLPPKVTLNRKALMGSHDYVPPTQYDTPIPKRLQITHVLSVYWETIPLFVTTAIAFSVCACAIAWATQHKVDVVFKTHSRDNISRTMDLRNPDVMKILIFNQRYPPWPEMQDVLDKMSLAQKRADMRAKSCSHA